MSGVTVNIDIQDKEIHALLKQIAARISDITPAMEEIGEIVRASVVRNFRAGGRPGKWKKSSRAKSDSGQTLLDSGRLRNSFSVAHGHPEGYAKVSKDEVAVGTNVVYAAVHHFGAEKGEFGTKAVNVKTHKRTIEKAFGRVLESPKTIDVKGHTRQQQLPWGDIPDRPFLMIQAEDWTEIMTMLGKYLENGS